MSHTVSTAFIRQYETDVHLAYQRKGSLIRNTVRTKSGVQGESTTFQIIGTGAATTKARHGNVTPMNLVHTNATATLQDYYAPEFIDLLDLEKLNIDERGAIAESSAAALGRTTDQILIDAMVAATNSTTITVTNGATIRNSFLTAVTALANRDVMFDGEVFGLISPQMDAQLMTVPEYKDADFIGDDLPFKSMGIRPRTWLRVNWIMHTGLPLSTNTRTGFIYHRRAVGHAIGSDVRARIDWVPEKAAWLANSMMSMGAVLIDNNGVQEVTMDESAALATA